MTVPGRWLSTVVAAVALLSGCSQNAGQEGPYAAEFDAAYEASTSDFERGVLRDGTISDAEMVEARSRLVACLEDRGVPVEALGDRYRLGPFEDEAESRGADSILAECETGTTALIEPLYAAVLGNPQDEDVTTAVAECMVRHGARGADYSADDVVREIDEGAFDGLEPDAWEVRCMRNPDS